MDQNFQRVYNMLSNSLTIGGGMEKLMKFNNDITKKIKSETLLKIVGLVAAVAIGMGSFTGMYNSAGEDADPQECVKPKPVENGITKYMIGLSVFLTVFFIMSLIKIEVVGDNMLLILALGLLITRAIPDLSSEFTTGALIGLVVGSVMVSFSQVDYVIPVIVTLLSITGIVAGTNTFLTYSDCTKEEREKMKLGPNEWIAGIGGIGISVVALIVSVILIVVKAKMGKAT